MKTELMPHSSSSQAGPSWTEPGVQRDSQAFLVHRRVNNESDSCDEDHVSAEIFKIISTLNTSTVPSVDPTTAALERCRNQVLRPYMRFLLLVGWAPVFENANNCLKKAINILHPLLTVSLLVLMYILSALSSFELNQILNIQCLYPAAVNSTELVECPCHRSPVFAQYMPDVLNFVAYCYSFYTIRIGEVEQLPKLMEGVFVGTSRTYLGVRSQRRLLIWLRFLLYSAILWIILSEVAQVIHVCDQFDMLKFKGFPDDESCRIVLMVIMFIGFLIADITFIAVMINHSVQCLLLIPYIDAIREKTLEKIISLDEAMKAIAELRGHLEFLNYRPGITVTLMLLNNGTLAAYGTRDIMSHDPANHSHLLFTALGLAISLWWLSIVAPVLIAAWLTSRCKQIKKLGHEIRERPFGYDHVSFPRDELDSFLLYTSTQNLSCKIFMVPVKVKYIMLLLLVILVTYIWSSVSFAGIDPRNHS